MIGFWAAVAASLVLGVLWRSRTKTRPRLSAEDLRWAEGFTPGSYQPMERLLSSADYRFLESHGGSRSGLAARLRRRRCRIMLHYVGRLEHDFRRIYAVAKLRTACSPEHGPEFSMFLFKQGILFLAGCMWLRAAVLMHSIAGVTAPDVRPVLRSFNELLASTSRFHTEAHSLAA